MRPGCPNSLFDTSAQRSLQRRGPPPGPPGLRTRARNRRVGATGTRNLTSESHSLAGSQFGRAGLCEWLCSCTCSCALSCAQSPEIRDSRITPSHVDQPRTPGAHLARSAPCFSVAYWPMPSVRHPHAILHDLPWSPHGARCQTVSSFSCALARSDSDSRATSLDCVASRRRTGASLVK